MNTKLLMMSSALLMGISGVLLEFFPHEVLNYLGDNSGGVVALFVQLFGGLYLGFAITNWMAKTVLIGGIYARPLALGNFLHFVVGALALVKYALATQSSAAVWAVTIIYSLFAVLFGIVLFTHPIKKNAAEK